MRKQERRWPRTRWALLGMAACVLAVDGYITRMLLSTVGSEAFSPSDSALLFTIVWPGALVMASLAGVFIGLVIRDWRGNVPRLLLLRLLDTALEESATDADAG